MDNAKPIKQVPLHFPRLEVWRVANGWIVRPENTHPSHLMPSNGSDIHVFREWAEASKFISKVTLGAPDGR